MPFLILYASTDYSVSSEDSHGSVPRIWSTRTLQAFLTQYQLMLDGTDPQTDNDNNYDGSIPTGTRYTMVAFFILATIITQITMLNMLIAIMGDTFDDMKENEQIQETKTKLLFLADYYVNI